jgi:hypothetical protein
MIMISQEKTPGVKTKEKKSQNYNEPVRLLFKGQDEPVRGKWQEENRY